MLVLAVLLVAWLAFRLAGRFGARAVASWRDSGRWALAVMLVFAATAHFTSMRHDLARMVPDAIPEPMLVIYLTGILELAGAAGILLGQPVRRIAGIGLCALFIAMFPANWIAAQRGLSIGGTPATALWLRLPMQILFIWLAWWTTREVAPRLPRLSSH